MTTLLIGLVLLASGCAKNVNTVVVSPTPPPARIQHAYKANIKPDAEVIDNIYSSPKGKKIDSIDNNSNTALINLFNPSILLQAKALFKEKGLSNEKKVKNVKTFLNSKNIRWIEIDLSLQRMTLSQNGKILKKFAISASSGRTYAEGVEPPGKRTPHDHVGVFEILDKADVRYSTLFKVNMVLWQQYYRGHAIHNCQPRDKKLLGSGVSHGCVRSAPENNPYYWDKEHDIVFEHR